MGQASLAAGRLLSPHSFLSGASCPFYIMLIVKRIDVVSGQ